jgi:hypothetical protein
VDWTIKDELLEKLHEQIHVTRKTSVSIVWLSLRVVWEASSQAWHPPPGS